MLTEKELKQIKDYLALYGKKDSQLNNVGEYTPSSEDYLAIVKNGNNVTVTIEQLENTFLKTFLDDPAFEETWQGAIDTPKLADKAITTEKLANLAVITQKILDSAVTTAKIAPQAVTTDKIQDGAVTEGKIANSEVTEDKLATGAVTSSKIYEGAVTEDKIALGAITNSKIATGTISGAKFVDNSISGSKIQDNSVPGSKIKDGTIENVDIKDNSLSGAKLIDNSISGAKIAPNAIEGHHLLDNSIPASKILDGTIESIDISEGTISGSKIKDNTIESAKIHDGAITIDKIRNGAVTEDKLHDNAVTTDKILDNSVTTAKILNGAVTEDKIHDDAVTADKILNGSVTENKIYDGAVTANKIYDGAVTAVKIANFTITSTNIANEAITEDKLANGAVTTAKLAEGLISEIQNITDATPTTGSVKPVQSGGVKTAIDDVAFSTNEKVNMVGIDDEPTAGSDNLVKSGGVQNELALGAVYDVSAKNPTAGSNNDGKWESLFVLLSDANLSTLIPTSVRKGGMSIKFVQSSDNKYVQFLCTTDEFTTDVSCWQKLNNKELTIKVNDLLNHIQDFEGDELNIVDSEGNVILKVSRDGLQSVKFIDKDGNDILDNIQTVIDTLLKYFQNLNGECLYVTDNDGNIIFKINTAGAESIDFQANKRKLSEAPLGWYNNTLYVTDNDGNFVFCIDSNGIHCTKIFANSFSIPGLHNDWYDKIIATYGDSVTATNNGDFQKPFSNLNANWGNKVASYFSMYKHYGRGIGGQGYTWGVGTGDAGGSVCWLTPSGVLINRLDAFNYDNWDGETYPRGVTAEMEQQGTAIRVRGCLSSWLRITKMFPASIKDSIDVILVMAHNDTYDETPCSFVANDTTDPEWATSGSDYYGVINGDYNIDTFRGGVASTLMKLQLWMPNAVVVLMTGISGQGSTGELYKNISFPEPRNKAEGIREMSKLTSIPCIDTFANDGINGWNRTYYIADSIHPNYTYGRNMLSRAIIGGLKTILPKEKIV